MICLRPSVSHGQGQDKRTLDTVHYCYRLATPQGVPLEKFVDGCRVIMAFVREVEQICPGQIKVISSSC